MVTHQINGIRCHESAKPPTASDVDGASSSTTRSCSKALPRQRNNSMTLSSWVLVYELNKDGCCALLQGDYDEANRLFELALQKHKDMMMKWSTKTHEEELPYDSSQSFHYSNRSCNDNCMDEEEADLGSNFADCTISSPQHVQLRAPDPVQPLPAISMMSSCPMVRTFSYSGQNNSNYDATYHTVYALPILMSKYEWQAASNTDRSFAIIFNTAVCNHLYGMQQRKQQETEQKANGNNSHHPQHISWTQSFGIAKLLYRLALETKVSSTAFVGIECYPAIFNNISHLCKALEGYHSEEAHRYDVLLLKSVYWMMDLLGSDKGIQNSNARRESIDGTTSRTTNSSTATPSNNDNPAYETLIDNFLGDVLRVVDDDEPMEGEAEQNKQQQQTNAIESPLSYHAIVRDARDYDEMMDAFLENVFYLVSSPVFVEPAAAA